MSKRQSEIVVDVSHAKRAWEYRRIAGNNIDELNRYGREGWEVITLEGREVLMKREVTPPVLEQI